MTVDWGTGVWGLTGLVVRWRALRCLHMEWLVVAHVASIIAKYYKS